jgi:hypothetical protein
LLEPSVERVYHVVFANALHNVDAPSRATRCGERRQDQSGREALDLLQQIF